LILFVDSITVNTIIELQKADAKPI